VPRGFQWSVYVADDGGVYAVRVDADYALQSQRGLETVASAGYQPLPRGWLARRVRGVEPSGRTHYAVVGNVSAALWTSERLDFDVVDSGGGLQTCTVTAWLQERSANRPRD